MSDNVNLVR